jgi:hypothetical protein
MIAAWPIGVVESFTRTISLELEMLRCALLSGALSDSFFRYHSRDGDHNRR